MGILHWPQEIVSEKYIQRPYKISAQRSIQSCPQGGKQDGMGQDVLPEMP